MPGEAFSRAFIPFSAAQIHTQPSNVGTGASAEWQAGRVAYESALALFEQGRLSEACRALFPLLEASDGRHDKPALTLAARAIEGLRSGAPTFDPVIVLEGK